jgi:hypothetical protein
MRRESPGKKPENRDQPSANGKKKKRQPTLPRSWHPGRTDEAGTGESQEKMVCMRSGILQAVDFLSKFIITGQQIYLRLKELIKTIGL